MNKKILFLLILSLLVVVGCSSSYRDCTGDCYKLNGERGIDYKTIPAYADNPIGSYWSPSDDLIKICNKECKPK